MPSQTRVPTSEWTVPQWAPVSGSDNWLMIDEYPSLDDGDYIYEADQSGNAIFDFSAFSVHTGVTITELNLYVRGADGAGSVTRAVIMLNTNEDYWLGSGFGTSWSEQKFTWSLNPQTGLPWTADEINGIGTYGLKHAGFGKDGSEGPVAYVSRFYMKADYVLARALPLFLP